MGWSTVASAPAGGASAEELAKARKQMELLIGAAKTLANKGSLQAAKIRAKADLAVEAYDAMRQGGSAPAASALAAAAAAPVAASPAATAPAVTGRSVETEAAAEPVGPARSSRSYALIPLRYSASLRTPMTVLDDAAKMDPYKVLDIPFLSGGTRIRRAYAGLCKSEHPDKNGGRISMEWQMGEWAYRMLNDPEARAAYDTSRVLRHGLSLTEGIFKFGFSVFSNFGKFVDDAAKVLGSRRRALLERAS